MKNKLKKYFPMIRTKGEVLEEVKNNKNYGQHFVAGKKNTHLYALTFLVTSFKMKKEK